MEEPNYMANPSNRCYFCKHELYTLLSGWRRERGFRYVVDGNNLDDTGDYRPGRQAGAELEVRSPLIEAGLGKEEIRELSRQHGLPTWNQPASACLSSRIPYGSPVTVEKLRMIDRGEEVLRALGFHQFRVRHHGDVARIEIARGGNAAGFERGNVRYTRPGVQTHRLPVRGSRCAGLSHRRPQRSL